MKTSLLILLLLFTAIQAEDISANKQEKLVAKGEKILKRLCEKEKILRIEATSFNDFSDKIESSKACTALKKRNKKALIYFLMQKEHKHPKTNAIDVPKKSKCPVCGMFVAKYPKWVATIEVKEKKHYFDGVKDMMKFYIFDVDFPYDRATIKRMEVSDFYTLNSINATEAFYVIGSDIFGPMGDELIPFRTKESAQNFMKDHHADTILRFKEITPKIVMALDGLDYD